MQLLEVTDAVRPLYGSLGVKGLKHMQAKFHCMSVQYDRYIYYNQHYAHDWSG